MLKLLKIGIGFVAIPPLLIVHLFVVFCKILTAFDALEPYLREPRSSITFGFTLLDDQPFNVLSTFDTVIAVLLLKKLVIIVTLDTFQLPIF